MLCVADIEADLENAIVKSPLQVSKSETLTFTRTPLIQNVWENEILTFGPGSAGRPGPVPAGCEQRAVGPLQNWHFSVLNWHFSVLNWHFSVLNWHFSVLNWHFSVLNWHFSAPVDTPSNLAVHPWITVAIQGSTSVLTGKRPTCTAVHVGDASPFYSPACVYFRPMRLMANREAAAGLDSAAEFEEMVSERASERVPVSQTLCAYGVSYREWGVYITYPAPSIPAGYPWITVAIQG
jgi:hypothetical protein